MNMQQHLTQKLTQHFEPSWLEVINESDNHNVPPGSESHFKVILVTEQFTELSRIARHRAVNKLLQAELASQIHALAIHAYHPSEWADKHGAPASPPCHGGEN